MMVAVQAPPLEEIGDLGTTPVEQMLASFVRHGATGALFLATGLKQKAVELVEGVPAAVYSNLDAERLGSRLVKAKILSEKQLATAVQEAASAPNTYLGERLVAAGALAESALKVALQEQAEEKLLELLSWRQGHYRFHNGKTLRMATRPLYEMDAGALLRRAAQERIPPQRIDAFWAKHDGRLLSLEGTASSKTNLNLGEVEVVGRFQPSVPVLTFTTWTEAERQLAYGLWLIGVLVLGPQSLPSCPTSPPLPTRSVLQAPERFRAGRRHLEARAWPEALRAFEEAFEHDPSAGEYLAYLGWAYYLTHGNDRESLETAFDHVKRAIKLVPHDPTPWVFLGRLYQVVDRLEPAKRMFQEALQRDPHSVDAKRELRILEHATPRWKRALHSLLRR